MSYRPNALVTLERLKTALCKIRDGITFLGTVVHKGSYFSRDEEKAGYDKIIRIVNTGIWVQSPLIFRIMQRGNTYCDLVIKFNGRDDSNLVVGNFLQIGIHTNNYCVAVTSGNTCDIYMQRAEIDAYWSITDVYMNQHEDGFTITYPNEYYGTSAPSGTVATRVNYFNFCDNYLIRSSTISKGTVPSDSEVKGLYFVDKNGTAVSNRIGDVEFAAYGSNNSSASLRSYLLASGAARYAELTVFAMADASSKILFRSSTSNGTLHEYPVWYTGYSKANAVYADASNNSSITFNALICGGYLTGNGTRLSIFLPYNVTGGTASITTLKIAARLGQGGVPRARSGSSGATYTTLGSSRVSIWANGASTRTNEVTAVAIGAVPRAGFNITVDFAYAICTNNTGTLAINEQAVSYNVDATINLS